MEAYSSVPREVDCAAPAGGRSSPIRSAPLRARPVAGLGALLADRFDSSLEPQYVGRACAGRASPTGGLESLHFSPNVACHDFQAEIGRR